MHGDLLFIQVCSDISPRHSSTVQGKLHSPLLSAALQTRLTAGFCHCKSTYGDLLFIQVCKHTHAKQADSRLVAGRYIYKNLLCMQVCSYQPSMQGSSGFDKIQFPLLSAALQHRLTAGLYQCKHICANLLRIQVCSYPPHCNVALVLAKCSPRCSVVLCRTGLYQCKHTYASLLWKQVCTYPPLLQGSTDFGKMQSPLLNSALQHRLTAGLYQREHTYANLLCIQVSTYPPLLQCSTVFGKMQPPLLSAALQNRLMAGLYQGTPQ